MAQDRVTKDYLLDKAYPAFFHREQAPLWLSTVAQALGQNLGAQGRKWCELGCGQGYGAAILAASNPEIEFWGIDVNPEHIAIAQSRATAAGLDNLHFICGDIRDLRLASDSFDYIVSHGVLSWVLPEVRQAIAAFSARHLTANGMVLHHYMSEPGGAAFRSFHRVFQSFAGQKDALAQALSCLQSLCDGGAGFFQTHPHASATLARLQQEPPEYVAHEYLNPVFEPLAFADVAAMLGQGGLAYLGSATPLENIDAVSLPADTAQNIATHKDPLLRETLKDLARNQALRLDLYGSSRPLSPEAHLAALRAQVWMALPHAPAPGRLTFQTRIGPVEGDSQIFGPLLSLLAKGRMRFADLERHEPFANRPGLLNQALQMGLWAGILHPCAPQVHKERAAKLNRLLLAEAASGKHIPALAAPLLGSGLEVSRADLNQFIDNKGNTKLRHLFCLA